MTILPGVRLLSTRGLTAASARHPWRTIAAWMVTLVLAFGAIVTMLEFTSEAEITAKPESEQAYDLLGRAGPAGPARGGGQRGDRRPVLERPDRR